MESLMPNADLAQTGKPMWYLDPIRAAPTATNAMRRYPRTEAPTVVLKERPTERRAEPVDQALGT